MDSLWTICFILFVTQNMGTLKGYRMKEEDNIQTVIALYGEKVRIVCQDDLPLEQCGFLQPNGTKIMFTGLQRGTPECFLDVFVTEKNMGLWLCELMPQDSTYVIEKLINVRIGGRLAPMKPNVLVQPGDDAVLTCVTTEGRIPLDHCYFNSPTGDVITISRRTPNFVGRYSFPINKSLDRGDCAVTVHNVSYRDSGLWQCSGRLEHEYVEQKATIRLHVDDIETRPANRKMKLYVYISVLSTLVLIMFAVLIFIWKKCRIMRNSLTVLIKIPSYKNIDLQIDAYASIANCRE